MRDFQNGRSTSQGRIGKRREKQQEDRALEIDVMQMMMSMFMEAASAFTFPVPMLFTQCYQTQPKRLSNSICEQNNQKYSSNFNESDKGSHFTSL